LVNSISVPFVNIESVIQPAATLVDAL